MPIIPQKAIWPLFGAAIIVICVLATNQGIIAATQKSLDSESIFLVAAGDLSGNARIGASLDLPSDVGVQAKREEEAVRFMIQNENELINHRVTWLITVQGLLFTALGVIWDKPRNRPLMGILCLMGVGVSIIAFCALTGSSKAIYRLYHWWEVNKPPSYNGPGVIGLSPPETFPFIFFAKYTGPWSWLPPLFLIGWGIVMRILSRRSDDKGTGQPTTGPLSPSPSGTLQDR